MKTVFLSALLALTPALVLAAPAAAAEEKAKADKAYMEEMNLSAGQFINLKWIETVANKQGANIDVMVGPAESMWNIRRN